MSGPPRDSDSERHPDASGGPLALPLLSAREQSLEARLSVIRHALIERIWLSLFAISLLAAPASALRSLATGWQPIYSVHLGLGALVVIFFLLRRRLSPRYEALAVMMLFWSIGFVGLFLLGLVGAGIWWLVVSALLMSTLYSVRAGIITMIVVLLLIVVAGIGFTSGFLALHFDANAYVRSPASWLTVFVVTGVMPLIIFQAVASLQTMTIGLLKEVDSQRQRIEALASHDELTGVPLRRLAMDRLEQALLSVPRTRQRIALMYVDLDGFKAINDLHGHEAGNIVLQAAAARFSSAVRSEDTVARLGGDEFVAILRGVNEADAALRIAQKMLAALNAPIAYRDRSLSVGASIGIAISADHGGGADELIHAADTAMYEAKRAGTNQVRVAPPLD